MPNAEPGRRRARGAPSSPCLEVEQTASALAHPHPVEAEIAVARPTRNVRAVPQPDGPVVLRLGLKRGRQGVFGRRQTLGVVDHGPVQRPPVEVDIEGHRLVEHEVVGHAGLGRRLPFEDRLERCNRNLAKLGLTVPPEHCFFGFDAYEKLLGHPDVNYVILATPPHFRPQHLLAAIQAGKNVFMEKPAAVDVPGVKMVMQAGELAKQKGLGIAAGTQRRHAPSYNETIKRLRDGAIGEIVYAKCYWNGGQIWVIDREPGWSDMEYQIRDWVNWGWLSGDIIVEQHIHHLDAMLWIMDKTPIKATGMGARLRRRTGDQYDFFSIDYEFDEGVHMHSTIRQLNGCANVREEVFVGTEGTANLDGVIYDLAGKPVWKYEGPVNNALVQEHVDWVTSIRTGKPVNTARDTALAAEAAREAGECSQLPLPAICRAPQDPGPGTFWRFDGGITYLPTAAINARLSYTKEHMRRFDTGQVAFDVNIVSLRTTYQFTRFVFARGRIDYDSTASNYKGQFLLGWTPNPGTAFYVGYNDDINQNGFSPLHGRLEPGFRRMGRTFFIKLSYLFRRSF